MSKTYSFPPSGVIKSKFRLDWRQVLARARQWLKESGRGILMGAITGTCFAVLLSLLVLVQVVVRRSVWFPSLELNAWQVIGGYFAAFVAAGGVVGAFAPALRWRLIAMFAGMFAGVLVYALIGIIADGWSRVSFHGALQLGLGLGGPMGYLLHYQLVPERRWPQYREVLSVLALGAALGIVELVLD